MKLKNLLKAALLVCIIYMVFATIVFVIEYDKQPRTGDIALLAISQNENQGAVANLYLKIVPGDGNLFIDSFPLTRADTQVATRYAKQTACDILDKDCSNLDFFYYLKSDSALVGGTSAGAATTLLTIATLEGFDIRDDVAITGTINSGGLVGPVGGIREKIIAAANEGFAKVLIPKWNNLVPQMNLSTNNAILVIDPIVENATLVDVTEDEIRLLEETYHVDIVRISNIFEAFEHVIATDTDFSQYYTGENVAIILPETYTTVMKDVADLLCMRYVNLNNTNATKIHKDLHNISENFYASAMNASQRYRYYSAGSYCFSANLRTQEAIQEERSQEERAQTLNELHSKVSEFDKELENKSITTVTDLEAYIITHQRIQETYHSIENMNPLNISPSEIAYGVERFISAKVWSVFFGKGDTLVNLDEETLKNTCESKLEEASERINYLTILLSFDHDSAQQQLKDAYYDYEHDNYALCIFKATKAKAEADAVINAMFIQTSSLKDLLKERNDHIVHIIVQEQSRGIFPLLGYSYYEYASDLGVDRAATALLYQEYAMEFSKLSTYLKKPHTTFFLSFPVNIEYLFILTAGIIIGLVLSMFLDRQDGNTSKRKNKPGKSRTKRTRPQSSRKKR